MNSRRKLEFLLSYSVYVKTKFKWRLHANGIRAKEKNVNVNMKFTPVKELGAENRKPIELLRLLLLVSYLLLFFFSFLKIRLHAHGFNIFQWENTFKVKKKKSEFSSRSQTILLFKIII